mmetsp:Transcript_28092/g.89305  ORF Transcript_28092/g.89305 Transcript_28092/m.89305 type:complete len:216 (+) Transcript_28092:1286-1933(+)
MVLQRPPQLQLIGRGDRADKQRFELPGSGRPRPPHLVPLCSQQWHCQPTRRAGHAAPQLPVEAGPPEPDTVPQGSEEGGGGGPGCVGQAGGARSVRHGHEKSLQVLPPALEGVLAAALRLWHATCASLALQPLRGRGARSDRGGGLADKGLQDLGRVARRRQHRQRLRRQWQHQHCQRPLQPPQGRRARQSRPRGPEAWSWPSRTAGPRCSGPAR